MKLEFKKEYLSIDKFDPIELPDFTVLTGVNGAGKSHFLGAIVNQSIEISDTGILKPIITLFNYETFKLNNEAGHSSDAIYKKSINAWGLYTRSILPHVKTWHARCDTEEYEKLKQHCYNENKAFWEIAPEEYKNNMSTLFLNIKKQNQEEISGIYELVQNIPYGLHEITRERFLQLYKPHMLKNNFLPDQLGQIFWDYHIKYTDNDFAEFQNQKYKENEIVLTETEFTAQHGEKPWEVINEILDQFQSLQYKVNSPKRGKTAGSFQLKLKHLNKDNLNVDFNNLSSGEKVLMALVASIYKASTNTGFPNLLLLDEIDASLHPSMIQNMLNAIQNTFLNKGIKVILVTHSPTTIALAPEESIFVMKQSGSNRIEKKSKTDALNVLTQGFVTLDQGLKLFDEITQSKLTIITEGNNTVLIRKALEFYNVTEVDILLDCEDISGKNQLKVFFDFLSKIEHENKVLFVWDCDVKHGKQARKNTYPFSFPKNEQNKIADTGIENLFPPSLFKKFSRTIIEPDGETSFKLSSSKKREFEQFVLNRNNPEDFKNFSSLINKIKEIQDEAVEEVVE